MYVDDAQPIDVGGLTLTQADTSGFGIYALQVPACNLLRRFYQLGNTAINLILVPIAYLVMLVLSRFLGMLPVQNYLVRIDGGSKYDNMPKADRRENK